MAKKEKAADEALKRQLGREKYIDQRKAYRLAAMPKAKYKTAGKGGDWKETMAKDVSAKGCLLLFNEEMPIGARLDLEMALDERGGKALKVKGAIVRLQGKALNWYEYGIEFDALDEASRKIFADFCAKEIEEKYGP